MSIDTIVYENKNDQKRIALLDGKELKEFDIIDENRAHEGDIYLGKISHKLSLANGKNGFFVNIDGTTEGFLNADEYGMTEVDLTEGQSVVVQIAQEKRAEKGPRLARNLQFVGNYIVYCPYRLDVSSSSKIDDRTTLSEYMTLVKENTTGQEGWILRTTSVEVEFEEISKEMIELRKLYDDVRAKARTEKAPSLLLSKPNPVFDHINKNYSSLTKIVVDSRNLESEIKDKFGDNIDIEVSKSPFKDFLIEDLLVEALMPEINLPSGGRIFIEETKAVVAIDVDSGDDKANGSISRLNEEAAKEIIKHIRLRNLSGKIVIDFAGASEYRYLKNVVDILDAELRRDSTKTIVHELSHGGNVEITRARRRPSLRDLLSSECPNCHGTGRI